MTAPEGFALWSFLWGAGCRRLRLSPRGTPGPRDVVVSSLPELVQAVEDPATCAEALHGLELQLRAGLLERWLRDAVDAPAAAHSALAIRLDDRALKVERWLQRIGFATYLIDGQRIASVSDLAQFPDRGGDLTKLWDHLREGVPQERFHHDLATVRILEAVREADELDPRVKPLIACLRLGLRRIPWADRHLESLADLDHALLEPKGREALRGLLESRVLETWVEAIAPGMGALVAEARGLPAPIAVDRAVRALIGPVVYPVAGIRAHDFEELVALVGGLFHTICGDVDARARIRDALFGPCRLPGTPPDARDPSEALLEQLAPSHRADVFAWFALRIPLLHLGRTTVRSIDEYLAAIAEPEPRRVAAHLAVAGIVPLWYQSALDRALPPSLQGHVSEGDFPALCIAMGEAPPTITVSWSSTSQVIPEGGIARFHASFRNEDATREAVIDLSSTLKPRGGQLSHAHRLRVPPRDTCPVPFEYQAPAGSSGLTTVVVHASHAGPAPAVFTSSGLVVTAGFPWLVVVPTTLAWCVLVPALLMAIRFALSPLVNHLLYRGSQIELAAPGSERAALVGLCAGGLALLVRHAIVLLKYRRWWPASATRVTSGYRHKLATVVVVAALIAGHQRGFGGEMLLGHLLLGVLAVRLSERDLVDAALLAGCLLLGAELGVLLLLVIGGLDTVAIVFAHGLSRSGLPAELALAGWGLCGTVLGLAFGSTVALRAVSRPLEAEAVRASILLVSAIMLVAFGVSAR